MQDECPFQLGTRLSSPDHSGPSPAFRVALVRQMTGSSFGRKGPTSLACSAQSQLASDSLHRLDDEPNMLVQGNPEQLRTPYNVVAVDRAGERPVLHLLPHRGWLQ